MEREIACKQRGMGGGGIDMLELGRWREGREAKISKNSGGGGREGRQRYPRTREVEGGEA